MSIDRMSAGGGRVGGICVLLGLLLLSQAGCGKAMPPLEPVTIRFGHWHFDKEYYEALAEKFSQAYPHVTVELTPTRFNLGGRSPRMTPSEVDVIVGTTSDLTHMREQGKIISLNPLIQQDDSFDLSDLYPGAVELFANGGEIWAVPVSLDPVVMYYNQDLFDERGVPYPEPGWTWDDFLDRALAIRDPGAGVFGYIHLPPDHVDAAFFVYQHGGKLFDNLQNPTRTTFDDPMTIEALEWYARLFHDHDVAPTTEQAWEDFQGGGQAEYVVTRGVYPGRVGMWMGIGLFWEAVQSFLGEFPYHWGMAPLPRDVQSATDVYAVGYAISSEAQHLDVCWQWIVFLSQQMPPRPTPARRSLAESDAYEQRFGGGVAAVTRASLEDVLFVPCADPELEVAWGVFARAIGQMVDEGLTPQEAMDWAQREAEQLPP